MSKGVIPESPVEATSPALPARLQALNPLYKILSAQRVKEITRLRVGRPILGEIRGWAWGRGHGLWLEHLKGLRGCLFLSSHPLSTWSTWTDPLSPAHQQPTLSKGQDNSAGFLEGQAEGSRNPQDHPCLEPLMGTASFLPEGGRNQLPRNI